MLDLFDFCFAFLSLDWSFLRGFYDQGTHVNVERTLPAVHTCN